jgi:Arc/MetJ family transcription regulator
MTQVAVDDELLREARSVTMLKGDAEIVAKAMSGFVARQRAVKEATDYFAGDNGGKPRWDPEFAGVDTKEWDSRHGH